jgi:stage II sporulation protein D
MFTLVGRGWGHGIGMSQYGAEGYAINQPTWNYWNIITHYYTGVTRGKVSNKTIRVLLQSGISNATIAATGEYTITPSTAATSAPSATVPGGASATVTWSSSANMYQVVSGAQKWSFASAPVFTPVGSSTLLKVLTPDDNGHTGRYRGTVSIIHGSSGLSIVNSLPLESYLQGVVPREMPASWKPVALQAQAVAARAYAYRAIDGRGTFDVYCDTRSQVYGGYDVETPATNAAVSSTAGVVPLYGGSVIQAFFFSTSGGYTENNENVWGSAPLPYLRGVPDPYDTISPYHLWPDNPIIRSATTVAGQLATYDSDLSSATLGNLTTIAVLQRGVSPRVVKALVVGSSGTAIVSGTDLRVALNLRDTWVTMTSMSLSPAVADKTTISAGGAATLSGEIYPALAAGATVTLHYYRSGVWQTTSVPTTLVTHTYGGYSISSSRYSCVVKPPATTYYYFSSGSAQSPQTVITVISAVTPAVGRGAAGPPATPPRGGTPTARGPAPGPGRPSPGGAPGGAAGPPPPPPPPPAACSPSPVRSSHRSSAARPCGCRHGAAQRGTMPPAPASARRAPSACAGSLWPVSMRCACARLLRPAS